MARINIEDSLFKDDRFFDLCLKLGSKRLALGTLLEAWILAQKHWIKFKCIPAIAWKNDLNVLIEVELAKRQEDGSVYIKGSERSFKWLEQRSNAGKNLSPKKIDQLKSARTSKLKSNKMGSGLNGSERQLNGSEPPTPTLTLLRKSKSTYSSVDVNKFTSPETGPASFLELVGEKKKVLDELYPKPDYVRRQAIEASLWLGNNPQRRPASTRGMTQFFLNWLKRGWEKERMSTASNKNSKPNRIFTP